MPEYETVLYEKRGKVAYITLNRPEKLNALSSQLSVELSNAWAEFDADPDAHVAILSGNGRAFCSGNDLNNRLAPPDPSRRLRGGGGGGGGVPGIPSSSNWKPIIAAVHGYAYGAGFLMAAGADLCVAAEGTQMQITEVRLGAASGTFWALAWFYSGSKFANEIAITGRAFSAEEAFREGIINRVVPREQLIPTAEELANEILKNPPLSVRATVRSIRRLPQELARDAALYQEALKLNETEDFKEAARAFLEKRPPVYKGR